MFGQVIGRHFRFEIGRPGEDSIWLIWKWNGRASLLFTDAVEKRVCRDSAKPAFKVAWFVASKSSSNT